MDSRAQVSPHQDACGKSRCSAKASEAAISIRNVTHRRPGAESSYVDLWRFVLASYNAGPGCLEEAILEVLYEGFDLNWEHVAMALEDLEACDGAVAYVEKVTGE